MWLKQPGRTLVSIRHPQRVYVHVWSKPLLVVVFKPVLRFGEMRRAEELDLTAEGWLVTPYMLTERYAYLGASVPVQGLIFILPRMGTSPARESRYPAHRSGKGALNAY